MPWHALTAHSISRNESWSYPRLQEKRSLFQCFLFISKNKNSSHRRKLCVQSIVQNTFQAITTEFVSRSRCTRYKRRHLLRKLVALNSRDIVVHASSNKHRLEIVFIFHFFPEFNIFIPILVFVYTGDSCLFTWNIRSTWSPLRGWKSSEKNVFLEQKQKEKSIYFIYFPANNDENSYLKSRSNYTKIRVIRETRSSDSSAIASAEILLQWRPRVPGAQWRPIDFRNFTAPRYGDTIRARTF